jgi:hypothetical protein
LELILSIENDPVRPGEQWFFYWKTSAALWESKIKQFAPSEIIFIPLYWGLHADQGQWDFGQIQPEKDLKRLTHLLTQHGRKFCWLLPLTPAPFLPNGGVPAQSARNLSLSNNGVSLASLDNENKLHKMYSFFDPKIFQAFSSFLDGFGSFIADNKVKAPIWGVQFSYFERAERVSFFKDSSMVFEQGFSRYLKKSFPEGVQLSQPFEEGKLKTQFLDEVQGLFTSMARETLSPFWAGEKMITVLGSGPQETIERALPSGKSQLKFFKDIFTLNSHNHFFSSVLLNDAEKSQLISTFLPEHFGNEDIEHRYHYQIYPGELGQTFRPFSIVDIFGPDVNLFKENGLLPTLKKALPWTYQVQETLDFTPEGIESGQDRVKFFHASKMDRTRFSQMLKLFLMGQRIVFDKTGLHPDLEKRLQIFFLENNLKLQSVKYLINIQVCELGEGLLICLEGEALKDQPDRKKFWDHIFNYLKIQHPSLVMDDDVFCLWRIRSTAPTELNYLDVRRINLYNPTSYKKQVLVHTQKHFAFLKMIDPSKATAKSTTEGVEVELLPNGKIALDFGHYEERK